LKTHDCDDQRKLRQIIPEDRKRAYDMREAIEMIADTGSFLELRRAYGKGMITGFMRIEGRPFGLIANNPAHLGGAIDAEAAEKAGRFVQLCDGFDLPIVSFCDTPGFMVGTEHEKFGTVRRASSMLVAGASISVPVFMVVLRKGYGLGAQAMGMGSLHVPQLTIAWPTGEFGPMGLEGAVRLGYSKEIAAAGGEGTTDGDALFNKLLDAMIANGKAINAAMYHEIDAVIDPMETRSYLTRALKTLPVGKKNGGGKRSFIPTW
jgi:acetyl-CoA carboxylase carboxyltransferase component